MGEGSAPLNTPRGRARRTPIHPDPEPGLLGALDRIRPLRPRVPPLGGEKTREKRTAPEVVSRGKGSPPGRAVVGDPRSTRRETRGTALSSESRSGARCGP